MGRRGRLIGAGCLHFRPRHTTGARQRTDGPCGGASSSAQFKFFFLFYISIHRLLRAPSTPYNHLPISDAVGTLGIHWEADGHAKSPMRDIQPALAYAAFGRRAARPRMPAKGRCATFDRREETV